MVISCVCTDLNPFILHDAGKHCSTFNVNWNRLGVSTMLHSATCKQSQIVQIKEIANRLPASDRQTIPLQ